MSVDVAVGCGVLIEVGVSVGSGVYEIVGVGVEVDFGRILLRESVPTQQRQMRITMKLTMMISLPFLPVLQKFPNF